MDKKCPFGSIQCHPEQHNDTANIGCMDEEKTNRDKPEHRFHNPGKCHDEGHKQDHNTYTVASLKYADDASSILEYTDSGFIGIRLGRYILFICPHYVNRLFRHPFSNNIRPVAITFNIQAVEDVAYEVDYEEFTKE